MAHCSSTHSSVRLVVPKSRFTLIVGSGTIIVVAITTGYLNNSSFSSTPATS